MNRKEVLQREYERKRAAGGFDRPTCPRPQDQRREPVRRPWKGKLIGFLILLGAMGLVWSQRGAILGLLSSSDTPGTPGPVETAGGTPAQGAQDVPVTVAQVKAFLTPSAAEIEQLYSYVVKSPFVAENLQYRERMKAVTFHYLETNDTVNAFGGRRVTEKDGKKDLSFVTVLYGGAARYARLVGLAAALDDNGHKGILKKFVAAMPKSFCARCNAEDCVKFIANAGLGEAFKSEKIRQKAISYSSGTIVSVLAHESGHHALGHLLSVSEKRNLEIARNQEREADSFSSSVISASPFGEYIFAGTLFWHYAVAMQSDGKTDLASNHPLSKERFENFVRANAEKAAAMGLALK